MFGSDLFSRAAQHASEGVDAVLSDTWYREGEARGHLLEVSQLVTASVSAS